MMYRGELTFTSYRSGMDRRFAVLTATLSVAMFGGVWLAMTPPHTSAAADLREVVHKVQGSPAVEAHVYYAGCDEVRAAGRAPLFRDQPGYREGMDGDGDGVACEPHLGRRGGRWRP